MLCIYEVPLLCTQKRYMKGLVADNIWSNIAVKAAEWLMSQF
jgi:hypothetical protein